VNKPKNLESQIPLAMAALGAAFAEALLEVRPDLETPLKTSVLKWANIVRDRGADWELAGGSLLTLSLALHDSALFPKKPR
jgi:hypothetical protein